MTDRDRQRSDSDSKRRTVLKTLGAAAVAAGFGDAVVAQDDDNETEADDEDDNETEADDEDENETTTDGEVGDEPLPIILGGEATHWFGLTPYAIHDEENPTLELAAGEEYELVWINLDGEEHELIVEDDQGEELEASEESETAGEAVSMTFEATEEMTEYYCEYHPEAMRGEIELDGGFDLSEYGGEDEMADNETMAGNETDNETMAGDGTNETDDEGTAAYGNESDC